jgi:hypothetical protein
MGKTLSKTNIITNDIICLICYDKIETIKFVTCLRCNIFMHDHCEKSYRKTRGYCKCPHCQQIGTLGIYV